MPSISTVIRPDRPIIPFSRPEIGYAEKKAVMDVLNSGWLSTGKVAGEFEKEFRAFVGSRYAVATSSCTDALIVSLLALGIKDGEVITSPMTFSATVNAILAVGATPVFVDTDENGMIDPEKVREKINDKTQAIIPIHYTGAQCDVSGIMRIVHGTDIKVIEDAAHAFGGGYSLQGHAACYSFYPTKNITAGEGGMIVTNDSILAHTARTIAMQGLSEWAHARYESSETRPYDVILPGRKANMSDVHAAIGLAQLRRWYDIKRMRDAIWNIYEDAFGPKETPHSHHLYTISHPERDEMRQHLKWMGIGTGIHFRSLHTAPAYTFLKNKGPFPVAEQIGKTTLSLPISATMTEDDARYVVEAVRQYKEKKCNKC